MAFFNKRRLFTAWISFLMVFSMVFIPARAESLGGVTATSDANTAHVNAVIVIDQSGSMRTTDKDGQAKSAAKQFLDIIASGQGDDDENLSAVTDLAILSFNQEVRVVSDFTSVKSEESRTFMKGKIDEIEYIKDTRAAPSDTDIGKALKKAAEMLDEHKSDGSRNSILLFTDGKTEGVSVDLAKSQRDLEAAKKTIGEMDENTSFYCIGWNHQNTLVEKGGHQPIRDITNSLQKKDGLTTRPADDHFDRFPKANYLITDEMVEARNFMTAVAESLRGSDVVPITEGNFVIDPEEVIVEAHVVISSSDIINQITILAPDGDPLGTGNNNNYIEEGDDHYKVCKIISPDVGTYTVQVTCENQRSASSLLVKRYAVEAKGRFDVEENDGSYGLDSPCVGIIKITPTLENNTYSEPSFIDSINEKKFFVKGPEDTDPQTDGTEYSLDYDSSTQCFKGVFPLTLSGTYVVEAKIANDRFHREVALAYAPETGITRNAEGGYDCDIKTIQVKRGRHLNWTPEENLQNIHLDRAQTEDSKFASAEAATDGNHVKVTGRKKGSTPIAITGTDGNGDQWHFNGEVEVAFALKIWEIILIILGVLLILLLVFFLINKMKTGDGLLGIKIRDCQSGYMEEFNIIPPRGTTFNLWALVGQAQQRILAKAEGRLTPEQNALLQKIQAKRKGLEACRLKLAKEKAVDGSSHDTYKIINGKYTQDLSMPAFNDNELEVNVSFTPSSVGGFNPGQEDFGFGGGNGGFGGNSGFGDGFGGDNGGFGGNSGFGGGFGGESGGFGGNGGFGGQPGPRGGGFGGFGGQPGPQGGSFDGSGGQPGSQGGGFDGFGGQPGPQGGGFGGFDGQPGPQGGGFGGQPGSQGGGFDGQSGSQGGGFGGQSGSQGGGFGGQSGPQGSGFGGQSGPQGGGFGGQSGSQGGGFGGQSGPQGGGFGGQSGSQGGGFGGQSGPQGGGFGGQSGPQNGGFGGF